MIAFMLAYISELNFFKVFLKIIEIVIFLTVHAPYLGLYLDVIPQLLPVRLFDTVFTPPPPPIPPAFWV